MKLTAGLYTTLRSVLDDVKEEILNGIRGDMNCVRSEIANLNTTVSHLAEELENHKNQTATEFASIASELASVHSKLASVNAAVSSGRSDLGRLVREGSAAIDEAVNGLSRQVVMMNSSMRDDHDCNTTELSRVNGIISDLGEHLQTHSQQTTSAVAQLDTRLSSLNESITDDFSGVRRELASLNSSAMAISDKIDKNGHRITTELMKIERSIVTEDNIIGSKCGGTLGWRRAVYMNMSEPGTNCPSGWQLMPYSRRVCGRSSHRYPSCDSVFFPVGGGSYSQVCGRIRAFQFGLTDAFLEYNNHGIDDAYFSGVAVLVSTSGHLQLEHMRTIPALQRVHVTVVMLTHRTLWEKITSVSLELCIQLVANCSLSTPMMFSGMVKTVTRAVHVVLLTILRISPKPLARQLLIALN